MFYGRKGWSAAPHLFVAPDGIWLATPMRDIGIHAGTGNSGRVNGKLWYSIGLEMVGFYDKVQPSGAIWEQSKAVMGSLSRRLHIPPRQLISFHRDYTNQKSCPGWAVTKEWVWSEVENWLDQAGKLYRVKNGVIAIVRKEADHMSERVRPIGSNKPVTVLGEKRDGRPAGGSKLWYQVEGGYIHSSALVEA